MYLFLRGICIYSYEEREKHSIWSYRVLAGSLEKSCTARKVEQEFSLRRGFMAALNHREMGRIRHLEQPNPRFPPSALRPFLLLLFLLFLSPERGRAGARQGTARHRWIRGDNEWPWWLRGDSGPGGCRVTEWHWWLQGDSGIGGSGVTVALVAPG